MLKKMYPKPEKAIAASGKKKAAFKKSSHTCPCSPNETYTRLVEQPRGHFNCIKCGALAYQSNQINLVDGVEPELQPIYVSHC